jgi:hypothetical protein
MPIACYLLQAAAAEEEAEEATREENGMALGQGPGLEEEL